MVDNISDNICLCDNLNDNVVDDISWLPREGLKVVLVGLGEGSCRYVSCSYHVAALIKQVAKV